MDPRRTVSPETALASDIFDRFCSANTLKSILTQHRHLCSALRLKPTHFPDFYPRLRAKLSSWRAQALWSKFEKRASHKLYNRGKACYGSRVLIIGAGPCGLRTAIEAQLLGAKVVVIEKRDRFSRNNVLHLWPFVITDLKALGAKKFYGKFCAGSIDHISIRQLQCILLKVALLLGVEVHEGVGFEGLLEPSENEGWRAGVSPSDHPVSHYNFDVLIGADGRRNTLDGFKRKALRAKLAIAITANFINKHSEAEARVKEISGVSYIFNQKFFNELNEATGIDLENIVYYKDETHYFVMTAKKQSLLNKGVLLEDHADTAKLLSHENISSEALMTYALEAAIFSTDNQLPNLDFAVNHYGQPDVAMFDFTAMYAAENACRVAQRKGHKLLMSLVGDSLLEPFWPTGSGCARGFLSSFDTCWMLRSWASGAKSVLEVIGERESIYRLLGQTTPENLNKEHISYTLDPSSRYPNLNTRAVMPFQVKSLYDTDDMMTDEVELLADGRSSTAEQQLLMDSDKVTKKRRRDSVIAVDSLLSWLRDQVSGYGLEVSDVCDAFNRGDVLCAIINRFRPDLIEFPLPSEENVDPLDIAACRNQIAFDILHEEFGLNPVMSGFESIQCTSTDFLAIIAYLSQIYEIFRGEIPQIKYPRVEGSTDLEEYEEQQLKQQHQRSSHSHPKQHSSKPALVIKHVSGKSLTRRNRLSTGRDSRGDGDSESSIVRKHKKRRSDERSRVSLEERENRREEIERNRTERQRRRMVERVLETERFIKSMRMLQLNDRSGEISETADEGDSQFQDYTFHLYRQMAPNFEERCKKLEHKLFYSGRESKPDKHGAPDQRNVSGLAKNLEEKLKGTRHVEKKPKDLIRAIGKIEKSDWNVQLIEKKIAESQTHCPSKNRDDKVPKWSREAFVDKQEAMKRKLEGGAAASSTTPNTGAPSGEKSSDRLHQFDANMKKLGSKLREGNVLEVGQRGANKVSQMAEQLVNKLEKPKEEAGGGKPPPQKPIFEFPKRGGSELCHFCHERVYVVERMTAQGKYFHRNCFRCQYCNTSLRLSNYVFDREGRYGERFYCAPHYAMVRVYGWKKYDDQDSGSNVSCPDGYHEPHESNNKPLTEKNKQILIDMDERGTTPERAEFENSVDFASEDELRSEMDEEEWTDRNGFSNADNNTSDEASDLSDDDDITPEGGKAEQINNSFSPKRAYHQDAAPCNNKGTESSDSDTEVASGEESLNGDEEDEVDEDEEEEDGSVEDEEDEEEEEEEEDEEEEEEEEDEDDCEGSTTEIETDSEFAEDPPHSVPGKIPTIVVDEPEQLVTKIIQPTPLSHTQSPSKGRQHNGHHHHHHHRHKKVPPVELPVEYGSLKNFMVEPVKKNIPERVLPRVNAVPKKYEPLVTTTTHQDRFQFGSKLSSELKQRYLQGPIGSCSNLIKKSTPTVDPAAQSQFRSVLDMISEQQKLLQPAPKPSATMIAVLEGAEKLKMKPTVSPLSGSVNIIGGFNLGTISPINNHPTSWISKQNHEREVEEDQKESAAGVEVVVNNLINLEKNKEAEEKGDTEKEVRSDTDKEVRSDATDKKDEEEEKDEKDVLIVMTTSDTTATSQSETDSTIRGVIPKESPQGTEGPDSPEDMPTPRQEIQQPFPDHPQAPQSDSEESITESADPLSDSDDIDADIEDDCNRILHQPPRVEIEDEFGVSLKIDDNYISSKDFKSNQVKDLKPSQVKCYQVDDTSKSLGMSSSDSNQDSLNSMGMFLETEMSDWGREALDDKSRRLTKKKKFKKQETSKQQQMENDESEKYNKLKASLTLDLANLDFADVDGMSSPEDALYATTKKQGYCQLANEENDSELDAQLQLVCPETNSSSRESTPVGSEQQPQGPEKVVVEAVNPILKAEAERVEAETEVERAVRKGPGPADKFAVLDRVVPFSNARDSLDYRKMKNATTSPLKSRDLFSTYARTPEVETEVGPPEESATNNVEALPQSKSPLTARRLEEINKERAKQSDLIRSMVMARIWKSPEKSRRSSSSRGSTSPLTASSSSASGSSDHILNNNEGSLHSILSKENEQVEDVPPTNEDESPEFKAESPEFKLEPTALSKGSGLHHQHYEPVFTSSPRFRNRPKFDSPFSIYTSVTNPPTPVNPPAFTPLTPPDLSTPSSSEGHHQNEERRRRNTSPSFFRSMPDLTACLTPLSSSSGNKDDGFATPSRRWEAYKSASVVDREKARQAARARARLKSDQELGLEETDTFVIFKDKLRRKISVPEDEVFDPNAAVVVVASYNAAASGPGPFSDLEKQRRPESLVATSIRPNVDFPVAKTNPFVVDNSPEKKDTPGRRSMETDDFVHLQLRLNSSGDRKSSPEKAKSVGYWDNSMPDSFPNYFTPSQPPSFSSTMSDSNWILEKNESRQDSSRPRSNTLSESLVQGNNLGSIKAAAAPAEHHALASPLAVKNSVKALSSGTLLLLDHSSPLSHPAGQLVEASRGTSVPDFSSPPSNVIELRKNKKPKDRERRRSIIQAVSDFFTSSSSSSRNNGSPANSPSSSTTNSMGGGDQQLDKSNGSSPSSRDKFSSLFKLTPKLLQKDKQGQGQQRSSKSREMLSPISSTASDPIVPPAKPPRTGLASSAYWSQPDMVIQRLSASPTPFKSSRAATAAGVGGYESFRGVSTPPSSYRRRSYYSSEDSPRLKEVEDIGKQLEKIEGDQRKLELRGVAIEKRLKGEEKDELGREVSEIMEEWFTLVREKTRLARRERELRVKAQKLQLEERQSQVQERLDQSFGLSDIQKTPDQRVYENDLMSELRSLEKQTGDLLNRYHEDVKKYEAEDLDLEDKIAASSLSPRESDV